MGTLRTLLAVIPFNRSRTLALLENIEQQPDPQAVLGWRPGPGRAHIGWQLMHIAITEELLASERLDVEKKARFADLVPRFKGGSTPDDNAPTPSQIRQVLVESRQRLIETYSAFDNSQLGWIPPPLQERKLTLLDILHILTWHEPHHQGQAHLTFNLYKARQAT